MLPLRILGEELTIYAVWDGRNSSTDIPLPDNSVRVSEADTVNCWWDGVVRSF